MRRCNSVFVTDGRRGAVAGERYQCIELVGCELHDTHASTCPACVARGRHTVHVVLVCGKHRFTFRDGDEVMRAEEHQELDPIAAGW